jgi:3-oxoacyl-[acyl-carrier protein] reductase
MPPLANKIARVTGASRGIGAAIARRLARDGAKIIVHYARRADLAQKVAADIRAAGSEAIILQADLADLAQVDPLIETAAAAFGQLDILVNNAAVSHGGGPLDAIRPDDFEKTFNVNVRALLFACQSAARRMNDGGRIINISSGITRSRVAGSAVYSASKAAVEMITKVLAAELGRRQITVNALLPGMTETDLLHQSVPPPAIAAYLAQIPLGRLAQPDDIADAAAFLASPDARWITGESLAANGGL